jgi:hypothetical protein
MISGVGSVRWLAVVIATEEVFAWRVVTPTSACKHCQQFLCMGVSTVDAPLQEREKSRKNSIVLFP